MRSRSLGRESRSWMSDEECRPSRINNSPRIQATTLQEAEQQLKQKVKAMEESETESTSMISCMERKKLPLVFTPAGIGDSAPVRKDLRVQYSRSHGWAKPMSDEDRALLLADSFDVIPHNPTVSPTKGTVIGSSPPGHHSDSDSDTSPKVYARGVLPQSSHPVDRPVGRGVIGLSSPDRGLVSTPGGTAIKKAWVPVSTKNSQCNNQFEDAPLSDGGYSTIPPPLSSVSSVLPKGYAPQTDTGLGRGALLAKYGKT